MHHLSSHVLCPKNEGHSYAPEAAVAVVVEATGRQRVTLFWQLEDIGKGGALMSTSNKAVLLRKRASQSKGQLHGVIEPTVF